MSGMSGKIDSAMVRQVTKETKTMANMGVH